MTLLILDLVGILVGIIIFGKSFGARSLFAALSFAAFFRFYELFPPVMPSFAQLPWVAALLGGVLLGFGEGILLKNKIASGFDSNIALVVEKRFRVPVSIWYLITDSLVLLASLSYLPFIRLFYTFITVLVSNSTIALFGLKLVPLRAHGSNALAFLFFPLQEFRLAWSQRIPTLYWRKNQSMESLLWTVEPLMDSLP
jgi:uncharacterized membrane-anchored protein YitT (DUF2179 family)